jgi:hypothetical protein
MTDPTAAVIQGAKVTFESEQVKKTVITSGAGIYETDLPLGEYIMTVHVPGFRPYRRPLFRVTGASGLTFDITLSVASTCDLVVVPATPQNLAAAEKEFCLHEDVFPISSTNGVPFQLYIRYVKHMEIDGRYTYTGQKLPNEDPVFVAYNLFSLRADRVTYDEKSHMLEASGNVVVVNESGEPQHADYASFKVEDGQAAQR